MKANKILQCESEIKRLKRTLKRLKQRSVTVTLSGTKQPLNERGVHLLIGFIDMHFEALVFQHEYVEGELLFTLRAEPEDIYRVLRLSSEQTNDSSLKAAIIVLAKNVVESPGNTEHFL